MSFFTGFVKGLASSVDTAVQKSLKRTREFNDEVDKIRFERQLDEKKEWDDDVEAAQEALKRGSALFRNPGDGELNPNASYYAASLLKRSGNLTDYNNLITKLKQAQESNSVNVFEFFDKLPENYTVGSNKDYAQAFVGPMSDFTDVESYSPVTTPLNFLGKILGKPITTKTDRKQHLQNKLKAAGYDNLTVNSDITLPLLKFYNYKFNVSTKNPAEAIKHLENELANPEINKPYNTEKKEYYIDALDKQINIIKDTGSLTERIDANTLLIDNLNPEDDAEEINLLLEENKNLARQRTSMELNLKGDRLEIVNFEIETLMNEIEETKEKFDGNENEKLSLINNLTTQLDEAIQTKFELNIRIAEQEGDINTQLQLIENNHNRLLTTDNTYSGSQEANETETVITELKQKIADRAIGPLTLNDYNIQVKNIDNYIDTQLQTNPVYRGVYKLVDNQLVIDDEALAKVAVDKGISTDAVLADLKTLYKEIGTKYIKTRKEKFDKRRNEAFWVAADDWLKEHGDGVIEDDGKGTEEIIEEGKEDIIEEGKEDIIDDDIINKNEKSEKFKVTYPNSPEGVEKFIEYLTDNNKEINPDDILATFEDVYGSVDENIKTIIYKSRDSRVEDTKESVEPKKAALGDNFVNWVVQSTKNIIKNSSPTRVIRSAKTDYFRFKSKNDTENMNQVINKLTTYLENKNYSQEKIDIEINKLTNPAGLMSRQN